MPINVTIGIKGIALIYPKSTTHWKILFPFDDEEYDDCHDVDFTFTHIAGNSSETTLVDKLDLAKNNRKIDVFSSGNHTSGSINNLFSLTDSKAHGNGNIIRKGRNTRFLELTLPQIDFQGHIHASKPKYILFEPKPNNKYKVLKTPFVIGGAISGAFTTSTSGFRVEINDGSSTQLYLPVSNGENYEMIFDNDCDNKKNEFNFLYKHLVEENGNQTRQLKLEWVPDYMASAFEENELIDKWMFLFLQEIERKMVKSNNLEDRNLAGTSSLKDKLAAEDPTYPCFVYKSDGA